MGLTRKDKALWSRAMWRGQGLGGGQAFLQSELVGDQKLLGTFLWGSLRTTRLV